MEAAAWLYRKYARDMYVCITLNKMMPYGVVLWPIT